MQSTSVLLMLESVLLGPLPAVIERQQFQKYTQVSEQITLEQRRNPIDDELTAPILLPMLMRYA